MRFLVDANMPRSTVPMLQNQGHTAEHAGEIGLGAALLREKLRKQLEAALTR